MASIVKSLGINLALSTASFTAPLKGATSALGNFTKSVTTLKGAFIGLVGAFAIKKSIDAVVGSFMDGIDALDQMGDSASKLGISISSFQAMSHAANMAGTSAETLEAALFKMNLTLGKGETKGLEMIGLKLADLTGLNDDEKFTTIANAIAKIIDPARQAAAAALIFGKAAGPDMLDFLRQGSAGIDKAREMFKKMGLTLNESDWLKAGAFRDAIDELNTIAKTIKIKFAAELAPIFQVLVERITTAMKGVNWGELILSAAEIITKVIASLAGTIIDLIGGIVSLVNNLVDFGSQMKPVVEYLASWVSSDPYTKKSEWTSDEPFLQGQKMTQFINESGNYETQTSAEFEKRKAAWLKEQNKSKYLSGVDGSGIMSTRDQLLADVAKIRTNSKDSEAQILADQKAKARQQASGSMFGYFGITDDMFKDIKKDYDKNKDTIADIVKSTRTPLEDFEERIKELASVKGLDADAFNRAVDKATEDYTSTIKDPERDETRFAGALMAGSSAARSAVLQHEFGIKDPQAEIAASSKETAKNTADTAKALKTLKPFSIKLANIP